MSWSLLGWGLILASWVLHSASEDVCSSSAVKRSLLKIGSSASILCAAAIAQLAPEPTHELASLFMPFMALIAFVGALSVMFTVVGLAFRFVRDRVCADPPKTPDPEQERLQTKEPKKVLYKTKIEGEELRWYGPEDLFSYHLVKKGGEWFVFAPVRTLEEHKIANAKMERIYWDREDDLPVIVGWRNKASKKERA